MDQPDSSSTPISPLPLRACPVCGLIQHMPRSKVILENSPPLTPHCSRCNHALERRSVILRSNSRTAALAVAALILFLPAIFLPIMRIEQFGHTHEASVISGVSALLSSGHLGAGLIVLICSVILPPGKLLALLILSGTGGTGGSKRLKDRHRAFTWRLVEITGRWGMLDVLLVAILVAVLKLGDMMEVTPGPAAACFTALVVLSLLAAASFDPHRLWPPEFQAPSPP